MGMCTEWHLCLCVFPFYESALTHSLYKFPFLYHSADVCGIDEAHEFVERLEHGAPFMTTSCCPAYVAAVCNITHIHRLKSLLKIKLLKHYIGQEAHPRYGAIRFTHCFPNGLLIQNLQKAPRKRHCHCIYFFQLFLSLFF